MVAAASVCWSIFSLALWHTFIVITTSTTMKFFLFINSAAYIQVFRHWCVPCMMMIAVSVLGSLEMYIFSLLPLFCNPLKS
jgi:predicted MarR family transcription regulator